jgi:predicted DNA-binding transcriptional regulator AlpA
MQRAIEITGYTRQTIMKYARRGSIPEAYKFGPGPTDPWSFTERGLRQWMTPDGGDTE